MDWWFECCLLLFTCLALIVQIYAIWLIINKSPIPMHPYRFYLIANSLSDMFFALVLGFMMHPDLLFPAPALIIQGVAKYFGPYGGIIAFAMAVNAGTCQVHFQNWSLLYRWSVVQERFPRLAEFLTSPRILLFIAFHGQLIAIAIALGTSAIFEDPSVVPFKLRHLYNITLDEGNHQVVLLANLVNGLSWMQAILPIIGIGLFGCMLFWLFLSVSIIRLFRSHSHVFSTRTYQLHMQLNVLLIVQLLSPILLIIIPVIFGILGLIANAKYGKSPGQMGVLLFAIYALSNPLMTILFLTPYRRFTLRMVQIERLKWLMAWKKWKKVEPSGTGGGGGGEEEGLEHGQAKLLGGNNNNKWVEEVGAAHKMPEQSALPMPTIHNAS